MGKDISRTTASSRDKWQTVLLYLNLKFCGKQYNKRDLWHRIVAPHLSGGWQHNYSTKARQAGCACEQPIYSLMSMAWRDTTDGFTKKLQQWKHSYSTRLTEEAKVVQ
jgi:hypothetical protein